MSNRVQLPFHFNVSESKKKLLHSEANWIEHYNKRDYTGDWSVLALRSGWGHPENIYSVPSPSNTYQDTPLMNEFPELKHLLDQLLCEKKSVRLMKLSAGAEIKEHCDDCLDALEGEARLHVPILTHDAVEFYLEGERVNMKEGECWYLNFNKAHRVNNPGPHDRIHLVIDCVSNNWLLEQLGLLSEKS